MKYILPIDGTPTLSLHYEIFVSLDLSIVIIKKEKHTAPLK